MTSEASAEKREKRTNRRRKIPVSSEKSEAVQVQNVRNAFNFRKIAFNWIIVELFPRKIKPKYDTDPDYNRYLTWLTAHEDIEKQRDSGFHGEQKSC